MWDEQGSSYHAVALASVESLVLVVGKARALGVRPHVTSGVGRPHPKELMPSGLSSCQHARRWSSLHASSRCTQPPPVLRTLIAKVRSELRCSNTVTATLHASNHRGAEQYARPTAATHLEPWESLPCPIRRMASSPLRFEQTRIGTPRDDSKTSRRIHWAFPIHWVVRRPQAARRVRARGNVRTTAVSHPLERLPAMNLFLCESASERVAVPPEYDGDVLRAPFHRIDQCHHRSFSSAW